MRDRQSRTNPTILYAGSSSRKWRALSGSVLIADVIAGAEFGDGIKKKSPPDRALVYEVCEYLSDHPDPGLHWGFIVQLLRKQRLWSRCARVVTPASTAVYVD